MSKQKLSWLLPLSLFVAGCSTQPEDEVEAEFRSGGWFDPWWGKDQSDVSLFSKDEDDDDDDDDEDDVIYDILDHVRVDDADGNPVLYLEGNFIFDADYRFRCLVVGDWIAEPRVRYTEHGYPKLWVQPLFALSGNELYARMDSHLELAYTIDADAVYEGSVDDGAVLVTASSDLEEASRFRKLLIAALLEGDCGSPGVPDDGDDDLPEPQ